MTSSTVRMVLVEGDKGDGVTVDHDVFDVASDDVMNGSPADQVVAAILGTQESAADGGHSLKAVGVTWFDHDDAGRDHASRLREQLAARRIPDVFLVSQLHAAGALAQAVGRTVGYDRTAVLLVTRDSATMAVVETDSGSIVKVDTQSLHSTDAMAVLATMATALADHSGHTPVPDGIFVLGSGIDIAAVKTHIENLVSLPVHAPDEPELALARGAALAGAQAPRYEATTAGLAYSQVPDDVSDLDSDGLPVGTMSAVAFSAAATQMAVAGDPDSDRDLLDLSMTFTPERTPDAAPANNNKPFMLAGSALGSIFVVGVVALVISLAANIRPTVDQRPEPGDRAIVPTSEAPAPPLAQEPGPQADEPAPETIQAPIPVAAPRTVYAEAAPAPATQAPAAVAPAAPAPAPAAVPAPAVEVPAVVPQVPQVGAPPLWVPNLLPNLLFPRQYWQPSVPTYRPPTPTWRPPTPTWRPPTPTYRPPTPTYRPPTPTWRPPTPTWNPPTPTWNPPTWNPPTPTWNPPTVVPTQPPVTITNRPQTPSFTPQQPQQPVIVPTVPQVPQQTQQVQQPQIPWPQLFPQQNQQQSPQQQSPQQGSSSDEPEWDLFPDWDD